MFKKIKNIYNNLSSWGKILLFIIILIIIIIISKHLNKKENFEQNDKFLFKDDIYIYDNFYANVYDYLVFNNLKDDYEIGEIIRKTTPTIKSKILDIGCGTGHHVKLMNDKNLDIIGIDISPSMIKKAKENYPNLKFIIGDVLNNNKFQINSFTHIMCLYFTIYYLKNRNIFFKNIYKWLQPNGYFIIHLVDRENFDPILPPSNPLLFVSPQKYANKRITNTTIYFTDFKYNADFQLDEDKNIGKFIEKFKNKNGSIRKNEHILYMPPLNTIINEIQENGFILSHVIDMIKCQYEYQYLYIFIKPD